MGTVQQWLNRCFAAIKPNATADNVGSKAEHLACQYLQKQGLKLVVKNYQTKSGEIDLIMRDKSHWVFIEVKYRAKSDWADAAETVTRSKQLKVIKAAKQYLQQQKIYNLVDCRFDVIAIDDGLSLDKINWIQHAFY